MQHTETEAYKALETVRDPEVPVLTVLDLGIIRGIELSADSIKVKITPTYSGCPALDVIENSVAEALRSRGFRNVIVERVFSPAWSTDWISSDGKRKLKEFGIAPPTEQASDELVFIGAAKKPNVACPFCDSIETELRSRFGSTACKALHFCRACQQPFEHFKPH